LFFFPWCLSLDARPPRLVRLFLKRDRQCPRSRAFSFFPILIAPMRQNLLHSDEPRPRSYPIPAAIVFLSPPSRWRPPFINEFSLRGMPSCVRPHDTPLRSLLVAVSLTEDLSPSSGQALEPEFLDSFFLGVVSNPVDCFPPCRRVRLFHSILWSSWSCLFL